MSENGDDQLLGRATSHVPETCGRFCRHSSHLNLQNLLASNRAWAESVTKKDADFFKRISSFQAPEWLWIGCSDSRVPANELMGMGPGEVFVQRNVGNLVTYKDMNVMSCMEYAVGALKVKHIIVCGHYNCGAIKAALTLPCKTPGLVNLWINDIRDTRNKNTKVLRALTGDAQVNKLVELNVVRQVFNVCTSPVVQQAWDAGQELAVHGLVYDVRDGLLKELTSTITSLVDFETYLSNSEAKHSHEPSFSLSHEVLDHMSFEKLSFERQVLRRSSMSAAEEPPAGAAK